MRRVERGKGKRETLVDERQPVCWLISPCLHYRRQIWTFRTPSLLHCKNTDVHKQNKNGGWFSCTTRAKAGSLKVCSMLLIVSATIDNQCRIKAYNQFDDIKASLSCSSRAYNTKCPGSQNVLNPALLTIAY